MPRLPIISGYDLIKILSKNFGFRPIRQKGSHITLTNDMVFITIPLHDELDKGTLNAILKDAGVKRKDFVDYL
ncbi:MAG: type II toxin-antitoxin system HicA family toxin [Candidatus Aenigmarchaeota archaeon]|nr:type II toxin-antitoxin system HicA family toxin [Candidatus Aenigmarchaeota archaeon]